VEAVEAFGAEQLPPGKLITVTEGPDIVFDNVTLLAPELTRVLIADLNVKVAVGDSLLIVGPDGSGKTALLRTVAGLWAGGSGRLQRPPACETRFITQIPYLPPTTLRQALSYPCKIECPDDSRMLQILRTVNLSDLATRAGGLDTVQKWREFLSLGEQQKLSLASVILSKPKFAIIDDAAMVLEDQNESLLFSLLSSLGTTLLSAGPTASANLVKYHRRVLELGGDGTWKVYDANDYHPKSEK
jgi:putative ATP-binding cassette transporter